MQRKKFFHGWVTHENITSDRQADGWTGEEFAFARRRGSLWSSAAVAIWWIQRELQCHANQTSSLMDRESRIIIEHRSFHFQSSLYTENWFKNEGSTCNLLFDNATLMMQSEDVWCKYEPSDRGAKERALPKGKRTQKLPQQAVEAPRCLGRGVGCQAKGKWKRGMYWARKWCLCLVWWSLLATSV